MDSTVKKFPGKIQEGRRPGGLACNRPGGLSSLPGGVAVRRASSPLSNGLPTTSAAAATPGSSRPGLSPEPSDAAQGTGNAGAPLEMQEGSAAGSSPWMGLMLPAVSKNVGVAVTALRSADIIAVPTDTLYGFAGDARCALAVERIFETKGRDARKPLPICVADPQDVCKYAETQHLPQGLLETLLPGPVTLVLPYSPASGLAPGVLSGLSNVGIRVPDAAFIRAIAREFGGALALTSANQSTSASSLSVDEFRDLWEKCACVFDAGRLPAAERSGSTIVELTPLGLNECGFRILRRGSAESATREHLASFSVKEL